MARITRKNQKIFAGLADADKIAVFGTMKTGTPAYSSDVATLQSADYSLGWSNAILNDKAPYLEEMNGVQYGLSSQIAYILQQGLALEYDASTTYYKGSTVAVINGTDVKYYRSLKDNHTGKAVSNTTYWELDSISKIETYYNNLTTAINNCVKLTTNQTVAGNKTFTGTTALKATNITGTTAVSGAATFSNTVKTTGTFSNSGGATFTGTTKVPASSTAGTALQLAYSDSGVLKLGDGTLFQWGIGETTNHYTYVNLDVAYSVGYRVLLSDRGSDTSVGNQKVIDITSMKKFRVYATTANNDSFTWFTIGR